jgi:hypothetical protein
MALEQRDAPSSLRGEIGVREAEDAAADYREPMHC